MQTGAKEAECQAWGTPLSCCPGRVNGPPKQYRPLPLAACQDFRVRPSYWTRHTSDTGLELTDLAGPTLTASESAPQAAKGEEPSTTVPPSGEACDGPAGHAPGWGGATVAPRRLTQLSIGLRPLNRRDFKAGSANPANCPWSWVLLQDVRLPSS